MKWNTCNDKANPTKTSNFFILKHLGTYPKLIQLELSKEGWASYIRKFQLSKTFEQQI